MGLVRSRVGALFAASVLLNQQGLQQFSNRLEGLATQPNAGQSWELRSFVSFVEPYSPTTTANLSVRYYVPTNDRSFIEGREIVPLQNYLMLPTQNIADAGWRTFTPWPTGDVLIPKGIGSDQLGMVIWIGEPNRNVTKYAAAMIYHSPPPAKISKYTLVFRTRNALKPFTLHVVSDRAGAYHATYPHPAVDDRSTVTLEFDATPIPEGWTTASLSAGHQDLAIQDKVNLAVEFFHKQPS